MTEPEYLTVEEAAAVLRISRSAAYRAVKTGEIPSVRVGRRIRVPASAVHVVSVGEFSSKTFAEHFEEFFKVAMEQYEELHPRPVASKARPLDH